MQGKIEGKLLLSLVALTYAMDDTIPRIILYLGH